MYMFTLVRAGGWRACSSGKEFTLSARWTTKLDVVPHDRRGPQGYQLTSMLAPHVSVVPANCLMLGLLCKVPRFQCDGAQVSRGSQRIERTQPPKLAQSENDGLPS